MNSMGYCVLSLVLGALTVLQATINGKAGGSLGMGGALIINTSVLIMSVIAALLLKIMPVQLSYSQFRWWYLWPGFLGFIVLLYLPISIDKIGALVSFLWCLAGQLLLGLLWDFYVSGVSMSWTRVLGVGISIFGACLAAKK
ncbi:MAG: DMT family transporter [Proteobacteria bacterium]|nr:DMT family transporter [Pseudomonadota bacterium]